MKDCSMLKDLAKRSETESRDGFSKYVLLYIGGENDPVNHRILKKNIPNAYG